MPRLTLPLPLALSLSATLFGLACTAKAPPEADEPSANSPPLAA